MLDEWKFTTTVKKALSVNLEGDGTGTALPPFDPTKERVAPDCKKPAHPFCCGGTLATKESLKEWWEGHGLDSVTAIEIDVPGYFQGMARVTTLLKDPNGKVVTKDDDVVEVTRPVPFRARLIEDDIAAVFL